MGGLGQEDAQTRLGAEVPSVLGFSADAPGYRPFTPQLSQCLQGAPPLPA